MFSLGDTVLAFDSFLNRVTTWVGEAEPEVAALPKPGDVGTTLAGVASAKTWVLSTWGGTGFTDPTSLRAVWQDILAFDVDHPTSDQAGSPTCRVQLPRPAGERGNGLRHELPGQSARFRDPFPLAFGSHRRAGPLAGRSGGCGGRDDFRRVVALAPRALSAEFLQERREEWLSVASGPAASRIRLVFDNLPGELPAAAPPVRRLVHVGGDVWLQKFGDGDETGDTEWVVIDPSRGSVRATASIDGDAHLLGGSDTLAVVVVETELDEEVVQVRRIVR